MKRGILIVGFFAFILFMSFASAISTGYYSYCTDTDYGQDYYVKGTVGMMEETGSGDAYYPSASDSCNGNVLTEYYCIEGDTTSYASSIKYTCLGICSGGRCINQTSETENQTTTETSDCTDSDGGKNYDIRGIVKDVREDFDKEDFCSTEREIYEYWCEGSRYASTVAECPNGCEDGVCIEASNVPEETVPEETPEEGIDQEEIQNEGFKYAYWTCYGGAASGAGDGSSCNSVATLDVMASEFCSDQCSVDDDSVCGVLEFSVSGECGSFEPETEEPTEGTPEKWEDVLVCKNSCPLEDQCYPFGYRKGGRYCSDKGQFIDQLISDSTCDNNFECKSNVCADSQCVSGSFIKKIIAWFRKIFGE